MDIQLMHIKFMPERQSLVSRQIPTKKWSKDSNMLLKLLDQLAKALSDKIWTALIIWKTSIYLRTSKYQVDLRLFITSSMKRYFFDNSVWYFMLLQKMAVEVRFSSLCSSSSRFDPEWHPEPLPSSCWPKWKLCCPMVAHFNLATNMQINIVKRLRLLNLIYMR
jgi:hypothetical protein